MSPTNSVFLTAEWRDLVMLNYEVDPHILEKFVPAGTELDSFLGKTYLSLVGFRFCFTKLFGYLVVPLHSNFEEVNLRFYVRHKHGEENRRGVVFIAEIVPKRAVTTLARLIYRENYRTLPMSHHILGEAGRRTASYLWRIENRWCKLTAQETSAPRLPQEGTLEQFITEHYWGYSAKRGNSSIEYHVSHAPWKVSMGTSASFEGDANRLYGPEFGRILLGPPCSAFIAGGSPVTVFRGAKIT
jgi:uncharacterized protein YqjF (DUF2071 family)